MQDSNPTLDFWTDRTVDDPESSGSLASDQREAAQALVHLQQLPTSEEGEFHDCVPPADYAGLPSRAVNIDPFDHLKVRIHNFEDRLNSIPSSILSSSRMRSDAAAAAATIAAPVCLSTGVARSFTTGPAFTLGPGGRPACTVASDRKSDRPTQPFVNVIGAR